jgi:hypothetical protein
MSLKLSNFNQYLQISGDIAYLEMKLGEQFVIPFNFTSGSPPAPIDITSWVFTVDSEIYTATFNYNANGELSSVEDFTCVGPRSTPAGLAITVDDPLTGTGTLVIPSNVNPDPNQLIFPDRSNTMLNIITVTITYPSSVVGVNNVSKSLLGLIVRMS